MSGLTFIGSVRQQANIFLGAVTFLTRLPVGAFYQFRREELPRTAVYFPVVGMLVGLGGGVVLFATNQIFPALMAVLCCMAATVWITGGLHEDGLADAADGLIGGRDIQRRLEIMKDSRIGSYGALALWFSLTAKLLLLTTLLEKSGRLALGALVVAHGMGRLSSVALLCACSYARSEESKSTPFGNSVTRVEVLMAALLPVVVAVCLLGQSAVLCFVATLLMTWAAGNFFQKRIGGVTGDCLGAASQLVELTCYAVLVAQIHKP